jgi:rhodanese-related sulfurtransferase/DNA-binding transcriptional ArsR family regulator
MDNRGTGRSFKTIAFRELSRIGKALSDPTRLELLDLLCQSEKSVDHAARQLGSSIATVSHHLQILKASHLAQERRSGRFIHYRATETGKAAWKLLSDIGETSIAEVRSAVSQFFEKDRMYEPVELRQLRRKVDGGEILLLDVRPAEEFLAGHFPGAVSLPLRELEEKVKTIPRDAEVVAYCRGPYCVLAHDAVEMLRKHGIRAYHWRQGVLDWERIATTTVRARPSRGRVPAKGASL